MSKLGILLSLNLFEVPWFKLNFKHFNLGVNNVIYASLMIMGTHDIFNQRIYLVQVKIEA